MYEGVPSTPSVRVEIFKHAMHFVVMVALRKTNKLRKGRNRVHSWRQRSKWNQSLRRLVRNVSLVGWPLLRQSTNNNMFFRHLAAENGTIPRLHILYWDVSMLFRIFYCNKIIVLVANILDIAPVCKHFCLWFDMTYHDILAWGHTSVSTTSRRLLAFQLFLEYSTHQGNTSR